jgi:transposase-like protein
MKNSELKGIKRTQRDYTMGFKLLVVSQVEKGEMTYKQAQAYYGIQGRSTVLVWLRKHGILDWREKPRIKLPKMKETPAQKIKKLEKELADEKLKSLVLNKMVDLVGEEVGFDVRKKYYAKQSEEFKKKDK